MRQSWHAAHARQLEAYSLTEDVESMRRGLELMRAGMFPEQAAFADDARLSVTACCSRRAGKSHAIYYRLGRIAYQQPRETAVYVTTTLGAAKQILDVPRQAAADKGLRTSWVESKGLTYLQWPNGAKTWVFGCKDRPSVQRLRGPRYPEVVIDEAQSMAYLDDLVKDAAGPATLDLGGAVVICGTPGAIPAGSWYEMATAPEAHAWNLWRNTKLPTYATLDQQLADLRGRMRWTERSPTYRREYLGEWVLDREALVYPYDVARNGWEPLPEDGRRVWTVLGVDLGSSGTTAWVVMSTVHGDHRVWVRHTESRQQQSTSDVAALTEALRRRWSADVVVVDAGGLGGAYVQDMRQRYGMQCRAADKTQKAAAIAGMSGELTSGVIRVDRSQCTGLLDEWAALTWDHEASERAGRPVYADALPDHYADAALYAWRACRPDYRPEEDPPAVGSAEWYAREQAQLREARKREQALKARRR